MLVLRDVHGLKERVKEKRFRPYPGVLRDAHGLEDMMKQFMEKVKAKVGAVLWIALAVLLMLLNLGVKTARAEGIVPAEQVQITSCVINGDQVQVTGVNYGGISANDGQFYLFELQPYEDAIGLRTDYGATAPKGTEMVFGLPLNYGTSSSRLYSKFAVAVWDGEKYVQVSQPVYLTNPEAVARNQNPFKAPLTKKGLLIETSMLDDAFNLGVKHVIVNFPFQFILGTGIDYEYEGKTYHFNKALLDEYDKIVKNLTAKDLSVTAVILNSWNDATPDLYYPGVQQTAGVNYYLFNAATKEGFEDIKAIASFLAEHYGGTGNGKVSNWIIGNEINNQEWNYIGPMDINQYMKEYERAFRVFYTAIKSTSANDRVYFSTDYNWNHEANGTTKYNAKDVIDTFNARIKAGGQIDWNLAYHPYSVPLTEPEFWDDGATGLVTWSETSPIVNIGNLSVLTDYFQKPEMLNAAGQVRHIILSEQGFTSTSATRGECQDLQAAAIAYAYYIVDSNPYIDAFIMSRQIDAPSEAQLSASFGLYKCDMNQPDRIVPTLMKKSYEVYRNIDKSAKTLETTQFAKEILGIEHWYDVIPNFRWRGLEKRTQN